MVKYGYKFIPAWMKKYAGTTQFKEIETIIAELNQAGTEGYHVVPNRLDSHQGILMEQEIPDSEDLDDGRAHLGQ